MVIPSAEQRRRSRLPLWQLALVAAVWVPTTYFLGAFALVLVIESEAGQTDWMRNTVMHEVESAVLAFWLLPGALGLLAAWATRLLGGAFGFSLLCVPATIAFYQVLLVEIGTGR